ncbi:SRPBCC family protein [Paeniglutamicibacter cryotolerans]|uniref:SRPBCC family protein n=1 Tax=Paeniglutamicibacter cryotolerans TaxID=670079 RepID=A0A839QQB3_9MICC|nr:SRPBCC family protein [Paeniglutamicibacter cryotolerans]MBB2996954.1 hypothetical protein [Paeniglutamicibacter cryotolerans]
MEFSQEITVTVPRDHFIELFDAPENLPLWQKGLLSFDAVSGTPGEPGSTSRLTFKRGNGTLEMIETIIRRNLPDSFDGSYEAKDLRIVYGNDFQDIDGTSTRWVARNSHEFTGFMKVRALLFGKSFPKQGLKMMEAFKEFAEAHR